MRYLVNATADVESARVHGITHDGNGQSEQCIRTADMSRQSDTATVNYSTMDVLDSQIRSTTSSQRAKAGPIRLKICDELAEIATQPDRLSKKVRSPNPR